MPDIFSDLPIRADQDRVFDAVSTPGGLDAWWTKRSAGERAPGAPFQASINPLPGVTVTARAFRSGGSGATVALLPSPAQAVTDAQGLYGMALEPGQAAAAACLEIAYSSALKVDTPGVPLRIPPAAPETLHVDLVGP